MDRAIAGDRGGGPGLTLGLAALVLGVVVLGSARALGQPADRIFRETDHAVLEYRASALTDAEADAFARLVERGVVDVDALVGPSLPASVSRSERVRVIVSARVAMSRTHGRTVLLPLERVKNHTAPYLHEITHALLPSSCDCTWLAEGLASYVESWVAEHRGGYDAHVFSEAGDAGIHADAKRWLTTQAGQAVLPWVGRDGQPPRLEEDRDGVARPFYVLSHSFTKYIAESASLGKLVKVVMAEDDAAAMIAVTGRSDAQWKREWLQSIGAAG